MNLDELRSTLATARETESLQDLRDTFFEDAEAFIDELRNERQAAADDADDPLQDDRVNRISDDIRSAEQTIEGIIDQRTGKLVKKASLQATDLPADLEGLTPRERDLVEDLETSIRDYRDDVSPSD
jgi:DNA replication factor GINS